MHRVVLCVAVVCLCIGALLVPATASAQERASIVGLVRDSTGGVLPGVTVEASSPVLIEQARTAVTDSAGRYSIIDLRPGSYVVVFSLPGFRTVRREGIVLEGAFAAQVNADLAVGSVEETVTVSGASPVVDVQSTQNQTVLNRSIVDALPTARSMQGGASLVAGVSYYQQGVISTMSIHGSATGDQHVYFDGMKIGQNLTGTGSQGGGTGVNDLGQTELVFDAGSQSAEYQLGGVRMDSIPKEGGNVFSGVWRTFGSTGALQNNNVTPELAPFIGNGDQLKDSYETNVATGGPIRKNKLWYFGTFRLSRTNTFVANTYFPNGQQVVRGQLKASPSATVRLTEQISKRNKIVFAYYNSGRRGAGNDRADAGCGVATGNIVSCTAPEASYNLNGPLNYSAQAKWTSPVTNRLLLEVGESLAVTNFNFLYEPEVGPFDVQHFDATTGARTVAGVTVTGGPYTYFDQLWNTVANMSYVTGSHTFKAGVNFASGYQSVKIEPHGDMSVLTYVNGQPNSVTVRSTPSTTRQNVNADMGLFAQHKWTVHRLTLTDGGRWDHFNASVPANSAPAGRFVAARQAAAVPNVPNWNDWAVRLGGSYDLFGTGKTALKTSVGKFVASQATTIAGTVDPLAAQSDTRAWNDLDGNGSALDANGNAQYNEIGPSRNSKFGLPAGATRFDPNTPRPINWEESVSIQQELMSGVSVTAGYYRRQFYNIGLTRNALVDPTLDYTPFTITVPQDSRLPNGGGQVITMYNLNPNKLGVVDNVSTWSSTNTRTYDGFEVSVNARLPHGGFVFGGVTQERTGTNNCDVANPNNLRFCNQVPPFRPLYKASAGYSLPFDIQLSGALQLRPGIPIGSAYTFNSATAGVSLTGGGALTVQIVDPTTLFYDYVKTLDVRVARTFGFGHARVRGFVEIFNLPNLSTVYTVNETYGPLWLRPLSIVQGRRAQIGAQLDF